MWPPLDLRRIQLPFLVLGAEVQQSVINRAADLNTAKQTLSRLCGTQDPEAECQPVLENQLHHSISSILQEWRTARDALRDLLAGAQGSVEAREIEIKKAQKKLEYLETYQDVLIAKYIEDDCAGCREDQI